MKYSSQIKELAVDLLNVHEHFQGCTEPLTVKTFFQTWGSTSLGFEGAGGDALTMASTIVVFRKDVANVFFGGKLAYRVTKTNGEWPEQFLMDLEGEDLLPVIKAKEEYKCT